MNISMAGINANTLSITAVNTRLDSYFDKFFNLNMDIRQHFLSDLDTDMINNAFFEYMFINPFVYGTSGLNMTAE